MTEHEVMHAVSMCLAIINEHLCEHPVIKANPEWVKLAENAEDALCDLYNAIGQEHLRD